MIKNVVILVFLLCSHALLSQQISYTISFPNIAHHEALITVAISGDQIRDPVFRMSRSSPGRYATHEFGKNVYQVSASDAAGKDVAVIQTEGDVFEVRGNYKFVQLQYTLYGNYADGTYADIDESAVLLNMPAAFMWVKGGEKWPVSVHFNLPAGKPWTVATQLVPGKDSLTFSAPDLQYFMDSPVLIGQLFWHRWQRKNPDGKSFEFRLALDADLSKEESIEALTSFTKKLERLVDEEKAVFGEFPDFDYGTYTFLASINPYVRDDGMEHRNSTMITTTYAFDGSDVLLNTFAHEFFHSWNVERIRPTSLEPFNFEKTNMSEALWFAEGFTLYYGELLLRRAGFSSDQGFAKNMSEWINAKLNTPAGNGYSPVEMSRKAVFTDAGVSVDRNNYDNNFVNYYKYGASIALALDLELRTKYTLSLDDYMTAVWKTFGKTGQPYTLEGLENILGQVTKDKNFAAGFFNSYINGHQPFDYGVPLQQLGYSVEKRQPNRAWVTSAAFRELPNGLRVSSNTTIRSPLYQAGIDFNDEIISVNNIPVRSASTMGSLLEAYKPGDVVSVVYKHRGREKQVSVTVGENPELNVVPLEETGLQAKPAIKKIRSAWLNSHLF